MSTSARRARPARLSRNGARARDVSYLPRLPAIDDEAHGAAESEKEKADRQLIELLNELRVALPGAQFLFAFLLTVPFAARFAALQQSLQVVFYVSLLCTLAATILLMAPSVHHRVRWQDGDKSDVVRIGHRMFLAGMALLGLAMAAAVFLVTYVLLGGVAAGAATTLGMVALTLGWWALPLSRRARPRDGSTSW
jgi:hypothetical protein